MNNINNLRINFKFKTGEQISLGEKDDSVDEITVMLPKNMVKNLLSKIKEDLELVEG